MILNHRYNDKRICIGCGMSEALTGDTKCPGNLQPPFDPHKVYKLRVWARDRDEEPRLYDVQVTNGQKALTYWRNMRKLGYQINYEEADENTRRRFDLSRKPSH